MDLFRDTGIVFESNYSFTEDSPVLLPGGNDGKCRGGFPESLLWDEKNLSREFAVGWKKGDKAVLRVCGKCFYQRLLWKTKKWTIFTYNKKQNASWEFAVKQPELNCLQWMNLLNLLDTGKTIFHKDIKTAYVDLDIYFIFSRVHFYTSLCSHINFGSKMWKDFWKRGSEIKWPFYCFCSLILK